MKNGQSSSKNLLLIVMGVWIGVALGIAGLAAMSFMGVISIPGLPAGGGLALGISAPAVPKLDQPAPGFVLQDLAGEPVDLAELSGRVVVVNFWATWCGPCVREMPMFQEYQDRYPEELIVLAINDAEPEKEVRAFVDQFGFTYPILLDPKNEVRRLFKVSALPTTYFVDTQGVMRYQHVGMMSDEQFSGYLEELGVGE